MFVIDILPAAESYVIPVEATSLALTSATLGPVYVNTPVAGTYAKEPSPPASVRLIAFFASESALAVV